MVKKCAASAAVATAMLAQIAAINARMDDWEDVIFAPKSAVVVTSHPTLLRLADLLQRNPAYRVRLTGHATDDEAPAESEAIALSERRAQAVKAFLVHYRADPGQIFTSAAGAALPKLSDRSPEAGLVNRRVTLDVTDAQPRFAAPGGIDRAGPNPSLSQERLRDSGRAFLKRGESEAAGYGLYTYLLFASKPHVSDTDSRRRYLSLLEAFLSREDIEAVAKRLKNVDRSDLNVFYVPLHDIPAKVSPESLYEAYDYDVARDLLKNLFPSLADSPGPHLVSCFRQLTANKVDQYLHVNVWSVPPGPLTDKYVARFIAVAEEPSRWGEFRLRNLALDLHAWIESLATEGAEAKKGLISSIAFIRAGVAEALKPK